MISREYNSHKTPFFKIHDTWWHFELDQIWSILPALEWLPLDCSRAVWTAWTVEGEQFQYRQNEPNLIQLILVSHLLMRANNASKYDMFGDILCPKISELCCLPLFRNYAESFDCYKNCSLGDGVYENLVNKVTFDNKTLGHEILGSQRYEMMSLLRTQLSIGCNPSKYSIRIMFLFSSTWTWLFSPLNVHHQTIEWNNIKLLWIMVCWLYWSESGSIYGHNVHSCFLACCQKIVITIHCRAFNQLRLIKMLYLRCFLF